MKTYRLIRVLVALAAGVLMASAPAQTSSHSLPAGYETTAGNAITGWPVNTATDQKWHFVYDSTNFAATSPITITEIYLRTGGANSNVNAFSFSNWTVTLASSVNDYSAAGTPTQAGYNAVFASNFSGDQTVVRSGPWTGGPVPPSGGATATWIPLGLTSTFSYDPTLGNDFILQIEKCGPTTTWGSGLDCLSGPTGPIGGNRYGNSLSCTATAANVVGSTDFVPIIFIDYQLGSGTTGEYQINSPASSLDIDGVLGTFFAPAVTSRCTGAPVTASLASINTSQPWEAVLSLANVIPTSSGALITPNNQLVNLNLGAVFVWLLGGAVPNLTLPFGGNFSIPFNTPASPGTASFQMINLDPSHPDGFALSQACQLDYQAGSGTLPGPTGDDTYLQVAFGALPLCGPQMISLFGTAYTEFFVSSNGRVNFGAGDTDPSPTLPEALADAPFVGAWTDYDPNAGGTITLTVPAPGLVRVDWNQVPYWNTTILNTFGIQFDGTNGVVVVDGLLGIGMDSSKTTFLGMSVGLAGPATNGGAAQFVLLSGTTTNATDMIYEIGPSGSLAAGLNVITFTPNALGNYDWTAL